MKLLLMQFSPFSVTFLVLECKLSEKSYIRMFSEVQKSDYIKCLSEVHRARKTPSPRSRMTGLSRLCTETKYSFFCSKAFAISLLNNVPCKVIEIPEMSYTSVSSMVIKKRSPYKKFLNHL
jgi:hypothetical protein